ncbi:MAG: ABC transporter substrate-binding protein [Chromatiales bacterium]|nr:ABC transporter substrate-binding protein [Chromatiales bacterium]
MSPDATAGEGAAVGVLYPEIREPFRSVFLSIARGVSDELGHDTLLRPLSGTEKPQDILNWISENKLEAVVALGSGGPVLSDNLNDSPVPIMVGAVHMSQELQAKRYHGITLSPDPQLLLEKLTTLVPSVKRVTVVYGRGRDDWMLERAQRAAGPLGLEINAVGVDRIQDAASAYRDHLAVQESVTEALWLLQDSTVFEEQAILPLILKQAWNRKLIVFSSNPSHVQRGVLFALYPDNYRMGRSLGIMARSIHPGRDEHGMKLLDDLSLAFNVRTADHLGLRVPREILRDIDLLFPLR